MHPELPGFPKLSEEEENLMQVLVTPDDMTELCVGEGGKKVTQNSKMPR